MPRHEIFAPSVHISDLHNNKIYQYELSLAKAFVSGLPKALNIEPCPISGLERFEVLFEKWGHRYALCPKTWSLCLGAFPDDETIHLYFYESDLAKYRNKNEYQEAFTKLRKGIWINQIEWVEGRVRRYLGMEKYQIIDWGSRMQGWVEVMSKASFISNYIITEPLPPVYPKGQPKDGDIVLLFDVIQRCRHPHDLFSKIYKGLRPGGLLLLTCRSGSGFDILTLKSSSESIFPLEHICLPSPQGIALLIEQAGFRMLELTTPGLLDVQYVKGVANKIPIHQYFQRHILECGDDKVLERLQGFLQQNNLSSHLRVVAQKPE